MGGRSFQSQILSQCGIAIGPILFIIAILGILAAAIAAGSGSFTSGTTNESNGTKATTLIQIGDNLKTGMDRLLFGNSIDYGQVVIGMNNTTNTADLFSPTGGGITIPSTTMADDPVNSEWVYPTAIVPNLGSGASTGQPNRLAMIKVSQGVCDQVNLKAVGMDTTVANYDSAAIGDPANSNNDLGNLLGTGSWPTALAGKLAGCINDTTTGTFWFYQILAIR